MNEGQTDGRGAMSNADS